MRTTTTFFHAADCNFCFLGRLFSILQDLPERGNPPRAFYDTPLVFSQGRTQRYDIRRGHKAIIPVAVCRKHDSKTQQQQQRGVDVMHISLRKDESRRRLRAGRNEKGNSNRIRLRGFTNTVHIERGVHGRVVFGWSTLNCCRFLTCLSTLPTRETRTTTESNTWSVNTVDKTKNQLLEPINKLSTSRCDPGTVTEKQNPKKIPLETKITPGSTKARPPPPK